MDLKELIKEVERDNKRLETIKEALSETNERFIAENETYFEDLRTERVRLLNVNGARKQTVEAVDEMYFTAIEESLEYKDWQKLKKILSLSKDK